MSAKRFGNLVIDQASSNQWFALFAGVDNTDVTAVVNFCLQTETSTPAHVYLAYMTDETLTEPEASDILLYSKKIQPGAALQFGPLAVGYDAKIAVKVKLNLDDIDAKVSVMAYGFQETLA